MILNNGFNELVFENRHKGYGAYQLRKRYQRNVLLAGLISVSLFASGMFLYFKSIPDANAMDVPKSDRDRVRIIDINTTPPQDPPKPKEIKPVVTPPPGPKTPTVNQDLTTPRLVDKIVEQPTNHDAGGSPNGDPNSLGNNHDSTKTTGTHCDTCGVYTPPVRIDWTPDSIHAPDLDAFFTKNIRYPEIAKEQNIQGTVWLEFVVGIDGNVKDLKIAKSAHPLLDKEVLRVAPNMPKWQPVTFHGVPCEYIFRKPIHFILSK